MEDHLSLQRGVYYKPPMYDPSRPVGRGGLRLRDEPVRSCGVACSILAAAVAAPLLFGRAPLSSCGPSASSV